MSSWSLAPLLVLCLSLAAPPALSLPVTWSTHADRMTGDQKCIPCAAQHHGLYEESSSFLTPTSRQLRFLGWKMTTFVHFSITTFTGSVEGDQSPASFAPDPRLLDVRQWVRVAKSMGSPVAVLTAKHEAGFCLWPTNSGNRPFSVAAVPNWQDRDLVREFVDACHKEGIAPGLYFTAMDHYSDVLNRTDAEKRVTILAELTELLTGYGEIAYFWFDHYAVGIYLEMGDLVRKFQPSAVVLGRDNSQTGGETGYAGYPLWNTCDTQDGTERGNCALSQHGKGSPTGAFWKAWESDCSIYEGCHPWFDDSKDARDEYNVQSVDELVAHWEGVVGRGCEFILNVPPNRSGLIGPQLVDAASKLGAEIHRRYAGAPIAEVKGVCAKPGQTLVIPMGHVNASLDRVWLEEDVGQCELPGADAAIRSVACDGQRITRYRLSKCIGTVADCASGLETGPFWASFHAVCDERTNRRTKGESHPWRNVFSSVRTPCRTVRYLSPAHRVAQSAISVTHIVCHQVFVLAVLLWHC